MVSWSGGQVVIKSVFLFFFNTCLSKLIAVTKLVSIFFIPYLDFFFISYIRLLLLLFLTLSLVS